MSVCEACGRRFPTRRLFNVEFRYVNSRRVDDGLWVCPRCAKSTGPHQRLLRMREAD